MVCFINAYNALAIVSVEMWQLPLIKHIETKKEYSELADRKFIRTRLARMYLNQNKLQYLLLRNDDISSTIKKILELLSQENIPINLNLQEFFPSYFSKDPRPASDD